MSRRDRGGVCITYYLLPEALTCRFRHAHPKDETESVTSLTRKLYGRGTRNIEVGPHVQFIEQLMLCAPLEAIPFYVGISIRR